MRLPAEQASRRRDERTERLATLAAAALFIAISVPYGWFRLLALHFAVGVSPAGRPIVPALPALLTLSPGVALCASLWLFVKLQPKDLAIAHPPEPISRPVVLVALNPSAS